MAINESILESVSTTNLKMLAELPAINAVESQQRVTGILEKSLMVGLDAMQNLGVNEGLAVAAAQRGDLAKVTTEMGNVSSTTAALAEIIAKIALSTPSS